MGWFVKTLDENSGAFHNPILALRVKIDALVVESQNVGIAPNDASTAGWSWHRCWNRSWVWCWDGHWSWHRCWCWSGRWLATRESAALHTILNEGSHGTYSCCRGDPRLQHGDAVIGYSSIASREASKAIGSGRCSGSVVLKKPPQEKWNKQKQNAGSDNANTIVRFRPHPLKFTGSCPNIFVFCARADRSAP